MSSRHAWLAALAFVAAAAFIAGAVSVAEPVEWDVCEVPE